MKGKPKLFIVQSCRGPRFDYGVDASTAPLPSEGQLADASAINPHRHRRQSGGSFPSQTDILILYSSTPGYVAYRDFETGTWLVNCIDTVFRDHAHEFDLCKLLRRVALKMKDLESEDGGKQMVEICNRGFFHDLYFNPNFRKKSDKEG